MKPELHQRLGELIGRHGVPGASIAVLADGQVTTAAAGLLNLDTGVAATEDSVFQIGSLTKLYTTSLLMQLVDDARISLDAPVVTYLPELTLADGEVTRTVTLRHLLSHTSGIDGDHFPELGRGDDAVDRFIASCTTLAQTHPLGATMSYCNAGFVIAGAVIEKMTGQHWDAAVAARLVVPLGLGRTVTLPEDALRFRAAVGHLERDGRVQPVSRWSLPRSCGPAALVCASAEDVIDFVRLHLRDGRAADGTPVLSPQSVAAMQEAQVSLPNPYTFLASHWGLGWTLYDAAGGRVVGHDGSTIGQAAMLRVVPDKDVAIVLLTNGGHIQDLFDDLVRPLLRELAGVTLPTRPEPAEHPVDVAPDDHVDDHVGIYERLGNRIEIECRDGRLVGRFIVTGPLATRVPDPVTELHLDPVRTDLFVLRQPGERSWQPLVFSRTDDGSRYVHFAGRATPKVA